MAPAAVKCDPYFRAQLAEIPPPDAADTVALVGEIVLKRLYEQTGRAGGNQPTNEFPKFREVVPHSSSPSYAKKPRPDGVAMSYADLPKTLGERVKLALQRRLFPKTNLTRQQLQHALRISKGTMDNLLSGNHDPSGPTMDKLIALFRDGFINEVWGAHNIHCICTRAQEKAARIAELHEELRSLA
jgi:hypothetical protein